MTGWRRPRPDEVEFSLDRWQIESIEWEAYQRLCEYPNRYDHDHDRVHWILPLAHYTWLCLRWPELSRPTEIPRGGPPTVGWPTPGRG